ncbi:MAG: putative toxin-antitoxin system toxin component, PIN family [Candidatus Blackburnbacteria bacterium RIFCSPHIGHO2_01_FULL_43_15b]|uniref:Putative toxin-antitoxin system toxin component, PIN family n=1 Tax=Candidatus Blackburnbacteria bacterium RIFCSPHIGHO2_01_FULL_43_15b TaxID=1797513 RepID=A0A1G1V1Z6_9BACT|nr:MAG: putative toxin-antitoxin system toxin component, PIN family [Candidatus Blackburnbacteria bacterium RIFCSPHIGHO2_01_FULL_43_15b]
MPKVHRVVFDTNIFISAILFGSAPRELLELARSMDIQLVTSNDILLELAEKLHGKFKWNEEEVKEVIAGIGMFAEVIKPKIKIAKITTDPEDNRILECAVEGKADFIISGDKRHVLSLKEFKGVKIFSPRDYFERILLLG